MKAIIVEDNPGAINVLRSFLAEYPSGIDICGTASTLQAAKKIIVDERPDLLLLDIRLHDKLVFSMLRELDPVIVENASIIFLTAFYDPVYIHEALKVSALDFIVKPIDREQLYNVLDKARVNQAKKDLAVRMNNLEERIRLLDLRPINNKIPIYRVSGEIDYEDKHDIIYVTTESNLTRVVLNDNRIVSTTRLLKFYEDLVEGDSAFLRISKQVILNLEYLKSFNPKTDTAQLLDGTLLQVSRRKSTELLEILSGRR